MLTVTSSAARVPMTPAAAGRTLGQDDQGMEEGLERGSRTR